jgi:hypothetical protein
MSEEKKLPMLHFTIYAIQHNETGRIYIGITQDLKTRLIGHMTALRRGGHSNPLMQTDFNEYGENYTVFNVEEFDYPEYPFGDERRNRYLQREREWMKSLNTIDPSVGYNTNEPWMRGNKHEYEVVEGVPTPNTKEKP